ncbi:hypothetical protein VYU27_010237, partial [Nannochloropsis oceanica]
MRARAQRSSSSSSSSSIDKHRQASDPLSAAVTDLPTYPPLEQGKMGSDGGSSGAQIRQMVNFILQEAHEKANEIRIKTEHDFNLEKQMLVHNATVKINDEYAQKEKNKEVEQRIAKSAEVGGARVKKLK